MSRRRASWQLAPRAGGVHYHHTRHCSAREIPNNGLWPKLALVEDDDHLEIDRLRASNAASTLLRRRRARKHGELSSKAAPADGSNKRRPRGNDEKRWRTRRVGKYGPRFPKRLWTRAYIRAPTPVHPLYISWPFDFHRKCRSVLFDGAKSLFGMQGSTRPKPHRAGTGADYEEGKMESRGSGEL